MTKIDWTKFIQIDRLWVDRQLDHHFSEVTGKTSITLYSVKVSGTSVRPEGLVEELHDALPHYVYSKNKIKELTPLKAGLTANHFFGKKDPQTDGKYGELLLFALTESVLGCKMIAHKIRTLTNFRDQVKGGDGIFLGDYIISDGRNVPAYLVGEAKVMSQYNAALTDALESVDRFCDSLNSPEFMSTELMIAKENLMLDDDMNLDELYNRLTPTTEEYKAQILVLPILLMFNSKEIKNAENEGLLTPTDLQNKLKEILLKKKDVVVRNIQKKIAEYSNISKVNVHFFLIPFNDVNAFRNSLFYKIHGIKYTPEPK